MVDSVKSSPPMFGTIRQSDDGKIKINQTIQGIDYGEYIELLTKDYDVKITKNKDKISTNQKTVIPAIEDIRSKLAALKGILKPLSGSDSISNPDIFNKKNVNFSASDGAVEMIVPPTMNVGDQNFSLNVVQLAKNDQLQSNAGQQFGSTSQTISGSGDLVINGQTIINIADGVTTLQDVVTAINASSSSTNVIAEAALTQTGQYTLLIKSTQTAVPISLTGTDASLRNAVGGLYLPDDDQPSTLQSLQAQVVYNGVTYFRSSNTGITDIVVDPINNVGATLNLQKPSVTPTIGKISYDRDGINAAIHDFVSVYNAVQDGIETYRNDETLKASKEFQKFLKGVDELLAKGPKAAAVGLDPTVNLVLLTQVGITKSELNPHHLEINEEKLKSFTHSTADQLVSLSKVFESGYTSSNTNFSSTRKPHVLSNIAGNPITITYTNTGSSFQATLSASGIPDVTFDTVENFIVGPEGTPYEGMFIRYRGTLLPSESDTTTLTFLNGIASQFSNKLEQASTKLKDEAGNPVSICDTILAEINQSDKKFQKIIDEAQKKSDTAVKRAEADYDKLSKANSGLESINRLIDSISGLNKH